MVRDFAPDHWAVGPGFVTSGSPTIYCQAADGKVLHRQDDFAGGADAVIAAVRRARENYDPTRDPDLRGPFAGRAIGLLAAIALGIVAIVAARRR